MKKRKLLIKCYCLTIIISLYNETKKRLNCFIYIVLTEHCWVIRLGEFKSDQKYIDDGIDQKSFRKNFSWNIYFWIVYFMANLSINKGEAIYFLIKTMYVIVFISKSMDPSYYYFTLSDIFRYGWNYLVIVFFL